jgi:hypothetical protein
LPEEEEEEEEDGIEEEDEEEEVINGVVDAILALELLPTPLFWTLLPVLFRLDLMFFVVVFFGADRVEDGSEVGRGRQ